MGQAGKEGYGRGTAVKKNVLGALFFVFLRLSVLTAPVFIKHKELSTKNQEQKCGTRTGLS